MFDFPEFDDHEEVVMASEPESGLKAVIAVHSTALGPAMGGARYWPYPTAEAALRDALNLSRGMTYKNALAGLGHGGGKLTIIGDPRAAKSPQLIAALARAIHNLAGRYYTAEDSGVSEQDISNIRKITPYALGAPEQMGDPSPATADGVFHGLKAAVAAWRGDGGVEADLKGARVGILGVGAVGGRLTQKLAQAGASLIVADVSEERTKWAAETLGAEISTPQQLPYEQIDVYAPCALGKALTADWVEKAPARVIAGAANNQLATPEVDLELWRSGRLYAPDFVVNAGGVINVGAETATNYTAADVPQKVAQIGVTTAQILARAKAENRPTGAIADDMALAIINASRKAA